MEIVRELTRDYVVAYNESVQTLTHDPEHQQRSFEKIPGLDHWYDAFLNADEVLALQGFVETSGVVGEAYQFWKSYGVVTMGDIEKVVRENPSVPYWKQDVNKTDETYPCLLIFQNNEVGKAGVLNMGNILDGNHRLLNEAIKISKMSEEERKYYRLEAYVANLDWVHAAIVNGYYMAEPLANEMRKMLGKTVGEIDPRNVMNVNDRLRLYSQRFNKPYGQPAFATC